MQMAAVSQLRVVAPPIGTHSSGLFGDVKPAGFTCLPPKEYSSKTLNVRACVGAPSSSDSSTAPSLPKELPTRPSASTATSDKKFNRPPPFSGFSGSLGLNFPGSQIPGLPGSPRPKPGTPRPYDPTKQKSKVMEWLTPPKPPTELLQREHFKLSATCACTIYFGDLSKWFVDGKSDAVIAPANKKLNTGPAVNAVLFKAAGSKMLECTQRLPDVAPQGIKAEMGDAISTRAFDLPVHRVIHTVGAVHKKNEKTGVRESDSTLEKAYKTALMVARHEKLKYLAFPPLSCNIYGYPYADGAEVAIKTLKANCHGFERIDIVIRNIEGYEAFIDEATKVLEVVREKKTIKVPSMAPRTSDHLPPAAAAAAAASATTESPPAQTTSTVTPDAQAPAVVGLSQSQADMSPSPPVIPEISSTTATQSADSAVSASSASPAIGNAAQSAAESAPASSAQTAYSSSVSTYTPAPSPPATSSAPAAPTTGYSSVQRSTPPSGYSSPPGSGYSAAPGSGYSPAPSPGSGYSAAPGSEYSPSSPYSTQASGSARSPGYSPASSPPASGYSSAPGAPQGGYSQAPTTGYGAPQGGHSTGYSQAPSTGYGASQGGHSTGYSQAPSTGYGASQGGHSTGYTQAPSTGYGAPQGGHSQTPYPPQNQGPGLGYSAQPGSGYSQAQGSGYSQGPGFGYSPQTQAPGPGYSPQTQAPGPGYSAQTQAPGSGYSQGSTSGYSGGYSVPGQPQQAQSPYSGGYSSQQQYNAPPQQNAPPPQQFNQNMPPPQQYNNANIPPQQQNSPPQNTEQNVPQPPAEPERPNAKYIPPPLLETTPVPPRERASPYPPVNRPPRPPSSPTSSYTQPMY